MTRMALVAAGLVLAALVSIFAIGVHGALAPLLTVAALVILIGGGNLLYGPNSHGAKAQARVQPAQEARNRAIDEARQLARDKGTAPPPAETATATDPPDAGA
jgi:hypothetical protein